MLLNMDACVWEELKSFTKFTNFTFDKCMEFILAIATYSRSEFSEWNILVFNFYLQNSSRTKTK